MSSVVSEVEAGNLQSLVSRLHITQRDLFSHISDKILDFLSFYFSLEAPCLPGRQLAPFVPEMLLQNVALHTVYKKGGFETRPYAELVGFSLSFTHWTTLIVA